MRNLRLLVLPALLGCAIPAFAQFVTQAYTPMKFIQTDPVVFPQRVIEMGLTSGEASIAVAVDYTGLLTDSLVVAYTHPAFSEAAMRAVKTWSFRPAMFHGSPRGATAVLDFRFRAGTVVVDLTTDSAASLMHFRLAPDSDAYSMRTLAQLDRIPTPTKIVRPNYSQEQAARSHVRHVTVRFYIDESGRVRMPAVSRETNEADEELSAAAVIAVEQWRFEPPLYKGSPVFVQAQQDFDFK